VLLCAAEAGLACQFLLGSLFIFQILGGTDPEVDLDAVLFCRGVHQGSDGADGEAVSSDDVAYILLGELNAIHDGARGVSAHGDAGLLGVVDQVRDDVGEELAEGFRGVQGGEVRKSLNQRKAAG
jgi:hypothetical protein